MKLRKRLFMAMILAAVIAMTFTACSDNVKKASSNDRGNEYVWQSDFQYINLNIDDISNLCMKDGRIYMLGKRQVKNKKNKSKGKQYQSLISFETDGSDLRQVELEGFEDGEYARVLTVDAQNQFRLLTQKSDYNEKIGEDTQYYDIHTLNEEGSMIDTIELKKENTKFEDEGFSFCSNRTVFHDGRLYAAVYSKIYTFDEKGEAGRVYKNDNNIDSLLQSADGKIYVYGYNGHQYQLKEFEPETGKFGTAVDFGEYSFNNADIHAGKESKIYINDRENVYSFDFSNGRIEKEFNWLNSGIDGNCIIGYVLLEDGRFLAVSKNDSSSTGNAIELILMSRVKASDIKEKQILRLSSISLDSDMKSRILSFNKTNEKYRIEVKEYSAYDDAAERLSLDIATGNVPDILDVSHGISTEQFIKKGLLADLYPFMEKDEEIKKEKFVPSVLRTLENDGKLYYMPVSFSIRGLVAGKKMVGDREGWSVEEMIKAYHELPEDVIFMQYITKLWFVHSIVQYQIKDYINWSTGEINFNSDNFIKLIEVAGEFLDKEENSAHSQESTSVLVKKGKLLLNDLYLDEVSGIELYTRLYKKLYEKQGGYTILSYPSSDKNNKLSMTLDDYALAITNQCNHKQGAWEFIRQFLSYDYQKSMKLDGFPTRQDVLDKKLEYARAEKAYTDDDGTKVKPIHSIYTYDGYDMKRGPVSGEEIELLRSIIDRIGVCLSYDTVTKEIGNIIAEEMEAFFSGDKSAKETAEVIQSRVRIYVSVNS